MRSARSSKPRLPFVLITTSLLLLEIFIALCLKRHAFIRGSIGDVLATALVYFLVQTLLNGSPRGVAFSVFLFACVIEMLQYFNVPELVGLPSGHLLSIVMGRTFSPWDILMYGIGCLAALVVHRALLWHAPEQAVLRTGHDPHAGGKVRYNTE